MSDIGSPDEEAIRARWRSEDAAWEGREPDQSDEVDALRSERDALRAARIAYASEFPLNAEGDPDTGNIHANIRDLKAECDALRGDVERLTRERDEARDTMRRHYDDHLRARDLLNDWIARADAAEADAAAAREREAKLLEIADAAHSLSWGVDWNNGTMAKRHGQRRRLLIALARWLGDGASEQARAAGREPPQ